ncbi:MAG: hypothetical protein JO304_07790 [Solirubrobacterales bacterium]|nr:hypothetical protein [Solirubrobacterales bacterium]
MPERIALGPDFVALAENRNKLGRFWFSVGKLEQAIVEAVVLPVER